MSNKNAFLLTNAAKLQFEIGDSVYLTHDREQHRRLIVGIQFTCEGVLYRLASGVSDTWHYEVELSLTKDFTF